eukprot:scaffold317632_cov22-Tisochrysis_lutea.AAC.1
MRQTLTDDMTGEKLTEWQAWPHPFANAGWLNCKAKPISHVSTKANPPSRSSHVPWYTSCATSGWEAYTRPTSLRIKPVTWSVRCLQGLQVGHGWVGEEQQIPHKYRIPFECTGYAGGREATQLVCGEAPPVALGHRHQQTQQDDERLGSDALGEHRGQSVQQEVRDLECRGHLTFSCRIQDRDRGLYND